MEIYQKQYLDFLDLAKGIGIILVIMGHTVFPVHQVISLMHMPLFFFLSGLTLRVYPDFENFFLKKTDRILIPYVFFSIVSFVVARIVGYKGNIFNDPIWFLSSLFGAIILCEVVLKKAGNKWGVVITGLLIVYSYFSFKTIHPLFPYDTEFDRILRASVFVFAGYYFRDIIFNIKQHHWLDKDWLGAVMYTFLYAVFCYLSIFVMGADGNFLEGGICKYSIILFYITSISGILMIVYWSKWIKRISPVNWLGKHSLVIMCVHYPFLQWWNPFMSSLDYYVNGDLLHKGLFALLSYVLAFAFSIPFVFLAKKLIPRLTGYEPLLSK